MPALDQHRLRHLRHLHIILHHQDAQGKAASASSLRAIAAKFNARGIPTTQRKGWSAMQVKRVLERVQD
ncbi:hypothetical protein MAE02_63980 [Microvirga aerophila]|uniref:Recombinase domain-containing protein n=1 Tax=Microvirga aerophila TaxID=670291 RepID=A0A512C3B2_9HYPH|nr:hypothetical protein MAE02_63980 [Microvirga aerophila]